MCQQGYVTLFPPTLFTICIMFPSLREETGIQDLSIPHIHVNQKHFNRNILLGILSFMWTYRKKSHLAYPLNSKDSQTVLHDRLLLFLVQLNHTFEPRCSSQNKRE